MAPVDILGVPTPVSAVLSPDGQRVAYLEVDFADSQWAVAGALRVVDVADDAEPLTVSTQGPITAHAWSDDGSLWFLDGDAICRVPLAGGTATPEHIAEVHGAVRFNLVSGAGEGPTGVLVWVAPAASDSAVVTPGRVWGTHRPGVCLQWHGSPGCQLPDDIDADLAGTDGRHVRTVTIRPDGGALAILSAASPDRAFGLFDHVIDIIDLTGLGAGRRYAARPFTDPTGGLAWHRGQAGWQVLYVARAPNAVEGRRVVALDVGSGEQITVAQPSDTCPVMLDDAENGTWAVLARDLDSMLASYEADSATLVPTAELTGEILGLSCDAEGRSWALTRRASSAYGIVTVGQADTSVAEWPNVVFGGRGAPRPAHRRRVSWRSRQLGSIHGLLLTPSDSSSGGALPALVVLLHGGPYERFADAPMADPHLNAEYLAAHGYAVLQVNTRGSIGRGTQFAHAVGAGLGGGEWADVEGGIDDVVAAGLVDGDCVAICGWSHGASIAAWAIGHSTRFRAAVLGAMISDWRSMAVTSDGAALQAELLGSMGWEPGVPHRHAELSPISSVAVAAATPTLLLHGESDTICHPSQSLWYARALKAAGGKTELVTYPGAGHRLSGRDQQSDALLRTRRWLDQHLGRGS